MVSEPAADRQGSATTQPPGPLAFIYTPSPAATNPSPCAGRRRRARFLLLPGAELEACTAAAGPRSRSCPAGGGPLRPGGAAGRAVPCRAVPEGRSSGRQTKAGRGRQRGGAVTGRRRLRSQGRAAGRGPGWARAAPASFPSPPSPRPALPPPCPPNPGGFTWSSVKRISLSAALDAIALGFEVRTWPLPLPAGRGAREAGPGPALRAHRGRGERPALRQPDGGAREGPLPPPQRSWGARRGAALPAGPPCAPPPCRGARPWRRSAAAAAGAGAAAGTAAAAAAAPAAAADVAPFGCHPVAKAPLLCGSRST